MRNTNTLGKDAVSLTISKVVTLLITTVTSMLLSRFRTFEEYGTYSELILVITLVTSIFMLGLPNSINYFLAKARTRNDQKKFLGVYYTLSTLISMVMGIVLAISAPLISSYFDNPAILSFTYFLLIYPWANITSNSVENILIIYHKTQYLTIYRIINSLCLLGAVLVVQWLDLTFKEYMIANLSIYVCFALVVYLIAYKVSGGFYPYLEKKLIHSIFVFSLPLGLSAVVGTLNIEIDKLLIGFLMNTEQLAIYTNASKELPVSFIATSITAVLLPHLTRMLDKNRNKDAVKLWAYAIEFSYIFICLISFGVFTYAEDVLSLLYSEKYLPGLPVFKIYSLVLLLRCTYFGIILNAKGKTKSILYAGIASLLLNLILNPLMYWGFGMIGPALGTFISMLVVLLWQLKQTSKYTNVPFSQVFPWRQLGKITLVNTIFALIFFAAQQLLSIEQAFSSLGEAIILGIIWAFTYLLFMRKRIKIIWNGLNHGDYQNEIV